MSGDLTIKRPDPPKFGIDQIVYIRESAMAGFLEPVKIHNFLYNRDLGIYFYQFIAKKSQPTTQTVGDAMDLKSERSFQLAEGDLSDYCESLNLAKNFLERELGRINTLLERCSAIG